MFMGFTLHFYIIFGTNLLTGGPTRIAFFLCAYFCVSKKRNIKRSPTGMKSSGAIFLEQMQSRRLGVDVKKRMKRTRGCPARPKGVGTPPTLVGPLWLHQPTSSSYIYPCTPKPSRGTTKNYFHRRNLLYPRDPILEPSSALRRRGNRPLRASTSSPMPFR